MGRQALRRAVRRARRQAVSLAIGPNNRHKSTALKIPSSGSSLPAAFITSRAKDSTGTLIVALLFANKKPTGRATVPHRIGNSRYSPCVQPACREVSRQAHQEQFAEGTGVGGLNGLANEPGATFSSRLVAGAEQIRTAGPVYDLAPRRHVTACGVLHGCRIADACHAKCSP